MESERRFGRECRWFALALIAVVLGSTARAAGAEEAVPGKKKLTVEELEQRIEFLEQALQAQQHALESLQASQPAAPARSADVQPSSPPNHPVTEQQAGSATQSSPQIFAGPGSFSFQSADGANQIRFHGEFDFAAAFTTTTSRLTARAAPGCCAEHGP